MTRDRRQDREHDSSAARAVRPLLLAGILLVVISAILGFLRPEAFFHTWLFSVFFWIGLPLGCGGILTLQYLTGGRWGLPIRPVLRSALVTLPVLAILFVPIAFGLEVLYPWAREAEVAEDPILLHKAPYLNTTFFLVRLVLFFALWLVGAWLLARRRPAGGDEEPGGRGIRGLASMGLILYAVSVTFAALDWVASLEPHWFSSIFGLYILLAQGLTAMSFVILFLWWRDRTAPVVAVGTWNDLGNLLLAMVVLHAYLAFSQWTIIWHGNKPIEITWYAPRIYGYWGRVLLVLVFTHFALPFLALIFRQTKRKPAALATVAALILAARLLESAWMVLPSWDLPAPRWNVPAISALAVLSPIGIGAVWLGLFLREWGRMAPPVLPGRDVRS